MDAMLYLIRSNI